MATVHDAITMVVMEEADILEVVDGKYVRSQYLEIPVPSVIKLRRYVKVPWIPRQLIVSSRNVRNRDSEICAYCGGYADSMDHILPVSRGGKNEWMNVVAACTPCNSRKDNRTPEEADMPLLYEPDIPSGRRWLGIGFAERSGHTKWIPEHYQGVS
jgi:5-methylcytosine-specific restriction endonuclease McrA